jgi:hypothetical protein
MNSSRSPLARLLLVLSVFCAFVAFAPAADAAPDGKIKSWTTAELVGAMRWAKAAATDRKERLDFGAAELVCHKRLQQQIESGSITRAAALLISETVRKEGVYKGEKLTRERAEELRRLVIGGKFLESLND